MRKGMITLKYKQFALSTTYMYNINGKVPNCRPYYEGLYLRLPAKPDSQLHNDTLVPYP